MPRSRVFVSSVIEGFAEYRQAARNGIEQAGGEGVLVNEDFRSFVRTWTAELAGKGIRANMVGPGPIETALLDAEFGPNVGAMKDRFIAMTPIQRIGRPEEIASAVLFLASDESSFITGVDLPVDGGTVAV